LPALKILSSWIVRKAGRVAFVGTVLAVLGGYYSVKLFGNLRTDFEELLPTTSRSVVDFNEVTRRLTTVDGITVVLLSQDTRASQRFVDDFAAKLRELPPTVVSAVEYRIDAELAFFSKRLALYVEPGDLRRIRDYVRDRIGYERELYNPLNIFNGLELPEPRLDFDGLREKYARRTSSYAKYPGGYYATADEKVRAVLIYMPGKATSVDHSLRFRALVEGIIKQLNPRSYAPDLTYRFTGGVEDTIEEHGALVADLELSTVIVCVAVALVMLIFYRNVRATAALVASLFAGTLWTFGISYFAIGYLNANSAFMGSIVIGNGINFGVILLARYLEERRRGAAHEAAAGTAASLTATATATAALAASLSYGSLVLTSFRGFSQFGVIGLIGMVLCWISSYALMPAYLTLLERWRPLVKEGGEPEPARPVSGAIAWCVGRFPGVVAALALAATAASIFAFTRYDRDRVIESDLSRLRSKQCLEEGSTWVAVTYLDKIFQRYMSPLVILPEKREDAEKIAGLVREKQRADGPDSLIANVQTLEDFVPANQREKIGLITDIRELLPPRMVKRLGPNDRRKVGALLHDESMHPIQESSLPKLILKRFTERDGSVGKLVLVEPPMEKSFAEGGRLRSFVETVRGAADRVAPGTAVAGTLALTYDMNAAITREGPRATLFAFVAVLVLVVLLFRRIRTIALCLLALLLGATWLGGFILGFGYKINFLNFIALPITFGIGVDYGVNVFQRYQQEGGEGVLAVIRNTGGAVLLCSLTTIIGYSSLLIASNQAFVSFGRLAVMGELTCVSAAIAALPAFLLLFSKRERK
jgi:predicted RND superfamily exporter protein